MSDEVVATGCVFLTFFACFVCSHNNRHYVITLGKRKKKKESLVPHALISIHKLPKMRHGSARFLDLVPDTETPDSINFGMSYPYKLDPCACSADKQLTDNLIPTLWLLPFKNAWDGGYSPTYKHKWKHLKMHYKQSTIVLTRHTFYSESSW